MSQLTPLAWPANWHYALGEPTESALFKQQWQDFQVPSACLDLDVVNVSLVHFCTVDC